MKKFILFNVIFLVLIFAISEIACYFIIKSSIGEYYDEYNRIAKKNNKPLMSLRYNWVKQFNQDDYKFLERPVCYGKNHKKSVLFIGCSYTYGAGVKEEETLSYLVNKYTGRTTVNKAIPGGSIINSLITLTDDSFYKIYKKVSEPEYVIYTYINDHLGRIYSTYKVNFITNNMKYELMPDFQVENGEVIVKTQPKYLYPLFCLYTTKAIANYYAYGLHSQEESDKRMFDLLMAAKTITDKKFKNSKFVVISYKDGSLTPLSEDLTEKLSDNGFIVLDAEKLAGHELESEKWRAEDKEHPNAEAYRDVAKGLVKALHL